MDVVLRLICKDIKSVAKLHQSFGHARVRVSKTETILLCFKELSNKNNINLEALMVSFVLGIKFRALSGILLTQAPETHRI